MGATPFQIIFKVLIPEAKPSLIIGGAIAVTTILSYSAMAGFVGGGGLGDIAIRFGYYRYETGTMMVTVVILVIIVQLIQEIGNSWMKRSDKRL
jgi:D-methionine transport system permease protein